MTQHLGSREGRIDEREQPYTVRPVRPEDPLSEEELSRRTFVQLLGAGLLVTVTTGLARGQGARSRGSRSSTVAARLHIGENGVITVFTGKVEVGQGSRAEISQAAAEELRVSMDRIRLVMADTDLVPDDGITAGSRTTPSTIPAVRKGAAGAREILMRAAAERWKVDRESVTVKAGAVLHAPTKQTLSYAELARLQAVTDAFKRSLPAGVDITPVSEWEVLGSSVPRPNRRDLVTGAHKFPSDTRRPGMVYGKVLRAPSYGASLVSLDPSAAEALPGVTVVRDGSFAGCTAPTSFRARQGLEALSRGAAWKAAPHPSSKALFAYLKKHSSPSGGRRRRSSRSRGGGDVDAALAGASKVLRQVYEVAYVQHAPLEPRAAVAQWQDGKLTVWTGTQAPTRVHAELVRAFGVPRDRVRVIVPDTGGGFGGKHSGEAAVEAARLARAVRRPVSLLWTRQEEFTWAYFRPAALIEAAGGLDDGGTLVAWDFTNINSGGSALQTPYKVPRARERYFRSDPPLRQGSYRVLAATANNFARECFMDELAGAAGADPLSFRMSHLENPRLRAVLETAARRFGWAGKKKRSRAGTGIGLSCGTEKGSYVAACVEVSVDRERGVFKVRKVCQVFECGKVLNPANLTAQVQGCIIMGLGPVLREEIRFENGKILNPSFSEYRVPRFSDVPELDIHLLDRPDLASAGGGETPIIAVAPAVANAVFDATGERIRSMPVRGEGLKGG